MTDQGQLADASVQYRYSGEAASHTHAYLHAPVEQFISRHSPRRIFELGCGNGALAGWMSGLGVEVTAIDTSESGIEIARGAHPGVRFEQASAYDELAGRFGSFPAVVSLEVIEHLFEPRKMVANVFSLLEEGGHVLISTPYHGYWKNLALAVSGKWDEHFTSLWDGGHIKFWSVRTLGHLLREAGFADLQFARVGRIAPLAKSLVVVARKPKARNP